MSAVDIAQAASWAIVFGEEECRVGAVRGVLIKELVYRAHQKMRVLASQGKLAPQVGLKIGHEKRGGDSLPGDIADQQSQALLPKSQKIVVVAADMAGLDTNARVIETRQSRKRLREESGLHLLCNIQLLGGTAFNFQPLGDCTPLCLDHPAHLVGGDQFKGVAVYIGETGEG